MEYIMETHQLCKSYKGRRVIDKVSMHVKKGEIYGFVGPNGAGKTTILKMLLNLTKADSGTINLFGAPLSSHTFEYLKRIGSIIENPYFYDRLSGRENLEMHCEYMGYHNRKEIDSVLELVSLQNADLKEVRQYSLGMKQRLAIARAILAKPEFLILDEPINALDPNGIKEMRTLFCRLREERNTSILISSHILSEVELIADTIGVIKEGKLTKEISIDEVHDTHSEYMELIVNNPGGAGCLLEEKLHITDFKIISDSTLHIFTPGISGREISAVLVNNGIELESMCIIKGTLEDYFFELTGEDKRS